MGTRPPSKAIQRAWGCIDRQIAAAALDTSGKLPGIRELARIAGVSLVTMHKALGSHPRRAQIAVVAGQGIWLKAVHSKAQRIEAAAPERSPRWKETRRNLLRMIYNGTYSAGELPPRSVLAEALGVSAPVLRRALKDICATGEISFHRRRLTIVGPGPRARHSTIALVSIGTPSGEPANFTTRDNLLVQSLESRSVSSGVRIVFVTLSWIEARDRPEVVIKKRLDELRRTTALIGVIVRTTFMGRADLAVSAAQRFDVPVAVLEELHEDTNFVRSETTLSFRFCDECGLQAARYLLQRGHQHVAYVAAFPEADWSQRRHRDLMYAFKTAGLPLANIHYSQANKINRNEYLRIQRVGFSVEPSRVPLPFIGNPTERFHAKVKDFLIEEYLRTYLEPAFEEAFKHKEVTFWLCDYDKTALAALDFLKRQRVAVPRRVSVMGFDNCKDSIDAGLTSYDFDIHAMVTAMLNHLFSPANSSELYPDHIARIPGTIVERATSMR